MKFYKTVLKPIKDPLTYAWGNVAKTMRMEDRMGNKDAKCPDCGKSEWMFLPKEGSAVRMGGKPYIECLECGYSTHL